MCSNVSGHILNVLSRRAKNFHILFGSMMERCVHLCQNKGNVKNLDNLNYIFYNFSSCKLCIIWQGSKFGLWLIFSNYPLVASCSQWNYNRAVGLFLAFYLAPPTWSGIQLLVPRVVLRYVRASTSSPVRLSYKTFISHQLLTRHGSHDENGQFSPLRGHARWLISPN